MKHTIKLSCSYILFLICCSHVVFCHTKNVIEEASQINLVSSVIPVQSSGVSFFIDMTFKKSNCDRKTQVLRFLKKIVCVNGLNL